MSKACLVKIKYKSGLEEVRALPKICIPEITKHVEKLEVIRDLTKEEYEELCSIEAICYSKIMEYYKDKEGENE